MTDKLVEQIKQDREAGTPGPWKTDTEYDVTGPMGWMVADMLVLDGNPSATEAANARRIARVPDMEARILADAEVIKAAEELAHCVERFNKDVGVPSVYPHSVIFALQAFRKSQE
jgi:hypothetical protein